MFTFLPVIGRNVSTSPVETRLICGSRVSGIAAKLGIPGPLSTAAHSQTFLKTKIDIRGQSEPEEFVLDSCCTLNVFPWYTLNLIICSDSQSVVM